MLFRSILADDARVLAIVKDELLEMKKRFGDERRTEIQSVTGEVDIEDLIADHRNLLNAIERCDLAAFEPLVERHLYGGIRRLGSKLTEEYADFFEPENVK